MLSIDLLLVVCLGYVALLFALAFYVDRRARQGRLAYHPLPDSNGWPGPEKSGL